MKKWYSITYIFSCNPVPPDTPRTHKSHHFFALSSSSHFFRRQYWLHRKYYEGGVVRL